MNTAPVTGPRAILRAALPGLLLATILLVPFLDKAFTIDDTVFLLEARHALADPLHPTAFDFPWNTRPERISAIVPTGPLMAWLLVPAVSSAHPEAVAHVLQLAMVLATVLATVALALRLGLSAMRASASGVLVAVTPAALGMAGTAMPDVPAMALGAVGLERLVAWRQDGKVHQAVSAAVLLGLAPLARTHLLALLGVGFLLVVPNPLSRQAWRNASASLFAPLAAAPVLAAILILVTRDPSPGGGSIAMAAAGLSSLARMPSNLVAFGVHWGLAVPFVLPWMWLRWRHVVARPGLLAGSLAAAAVLVHLARPAGASWMLVPLVGASLAAFSDVLLDAVHRRDGTQLTLGLWLLLALPAVVYVHLPAKYLLPSIPAAAILVARHLGSAPVGRAALVVTASLSALLGVAILRADATFAGLGRDAARDLIAPEVSRGRRVWYVGHWGFQWYAEQAGGRSFPNEPALLRHGDLVVSCRNCEPLFDVGHIDGVKPIREVIHAAPTGRVMDKPSGAGFFSNSWGFLPWTFGDGLLDAFDVYEVSARE